MKSISLAVLILLTGCSSIESFVGKAAEVNDEALKVAEFSICQAASVGSVKRRFHTPELARLWRDFCNEEQGFSLKSED